MSTATMDRPKKILTHPWQDAGIGTAPFRFITVISMPSKALQEANPSAYNAAASEASQQARGFGVHLCTCDVCGTGLTHNCIIRDANGKHFVVGTDCVNKTGDVKLITAAEAAEKARIKAQSDERKAIQAEARRIEREADQAAQRERNGGLLDWEVAYQAREAEAERKQQERRTVNAAANQWLVEVLLQAKQTPFTESIINDLASGAQHFGELSNRAWNIVCDIYAKVRGPQLKAAGWKCEMHGGLCDCKPNDAAHIECGDKIREYQASQEKH